MQHFNFELFNAFGFGFMFRRFGTSLQFEVSLTTDGWRRTRFEFKTLPGEQSTEMFTNEGAGCRIQGCTDSSLWAAVCVCVLLRLYDARKVKAQREHHQQQPGKLGKLFNTDYS